MDTLVLAILPHRGAPFELEFSLPLGQHSAVPMVRQELMLPQKQSLSSTVLAVQMLLLYWLHLKQMLARSLISCLLRSNQRYFPQVKLS